MRACGREKSEALGTRIAERVSCEGRLVVHVRGYDLTRPPEVQRRGGGSSHEPSQSHGIRTRSCGRRRARPRLRPHARDSAGAPLDHLWRRRRAPVAPRRCNGGGGGVKSRTLAVAQQSHRSLAGRARLSHGSSPTRATAQGCPWPVLTPPRCAPAL